MEAQTNELIYHPWAKMRLEWMQDNSPDLLRDLYQQGTLKAKIEKKVKLAINYRELLINKQNVSPDQAQEFAQELIAPADEMSLDDLEPMPDQEFQKILNDLM